MAGKTTKNPAKARPGQAAATLPWHGGNGHAPHSRVIAPADADAKAKAARLAMLASRTNMLLSIPMLTSMAMYQSLFG